MIFDKDLNKFVFVLKIRIVSRFENMYYLFCKFVLF